MTATEGPSHEVARLSELQSISLIQHEGTFTEITSRLPHEILARIFSYAQRMTIISTHDDQSLPLLPKFEVTVSHVSSRWRSVAIAEPRLWSNIHLLPQTSTVELEIYLERSKACPLNVRLDAGIPQDHQFDMLLSHLCRWRRFSSRRPAGTLLGRLRDGEANLLQHISISIDATDHLELPQTPTDDTSPQLLIGGAPQLSFVRLGGYAMSYFRPPLASITTLHLDQTAHLPLCYRRLRQVLTASPKLANLSIYGDIIYEHGWPHTTSAMIPIKMPALRSLRIRSIGSFVYCGILLNISAPRLESLTLKDVIGNDLDQLWDSPQMTSPSPKFPSLHSLTFCDFDYTDSTCRKLFRAFPAITTFTSLHSSSPYTPTILKLLAGQNVCNSVPLINASSPWPNLHTVTFRPYPDEAVIKTMIQTRINLARPIRKVRLGAGGVDKPCFMMPEVDVETFNDDDPWPPGLPYIDEDDHFLWS